MKNIEKYEKELIATGTIFGISVNTDHIIKCEDLSCRDCLFHRKDLEDGCSIRAMDWLLSEYKEPILDDIEKEYLKGVIKPFRDYAFYIVKYFDEDFKAYFIRIYCVNNIGSSYTDFPYFDGEDMYVGMKLDKKYTPKELDL